MSDGISESTSYTFSCYIYAEDSFNLRITCCNQDDTLRAGETFSAITSGEWTRFERSFTLQAGDTGVIIHVYHDTGNVDTIFYVDGAMLETGGSASEWVNYSNPSEELVIADASLALSADGSGSVDGLWDLGAYIYTSGSGIVLEVGGVDVLLAIANASLALSSESPALGPALSIANASLALSSENVVFQSSVSIDANRIARIIFVMKNG